MDYIKHVGEPVICLVVVLLLSWILKSSQLGNLIRCLLRGINEQETYICNGTSPKMIIAIDKTCYKCNHNDPVHHTVSTWSEVKPLLVVDAKWVCPNCGCKAAYWYFYRASHLEPSLTLAQIEEAKDQYSWQLFGFSEDASKNITTSPNFTVNLKDPTDWTKDF